MPFWNRGGDETDEQRQRREASLAAIEAGGIPLPAQERLGELGRRGGDFFTSDLSVGEFALVREAGFRPVTQVLGTSFYHVGWQWMPGRSWSTPGAGYTTELETQSAAWNEARRLAFGRLAEEAERAGAHAVVGVRVDRAEYDWASDMVAITAVGTAIASERYELGAQTVLSNLSGQEFAKLFAHGYWPVGIAAATTICYVVTGWQQKRAMTGFFSSWQNQELVDFTRGVYEARGRAIFNVQQQARALGADGIVGVRFDQELREREYDANGSSRTDLIVTLHVLGTAIVELDRPGEPPPMYVALPLDARRDR